MLDALKDWWGVVVAAVGAVAWLLRLESRGITNEREIRRLWAQRKEDLADTKESRDRTAEMLREIRGDIKTLLIERRREQ